MTRFLADALEAPGPRFRQGLQRLERANGHPNADIRFSTEVVRATRDKLRQLGLDPRDTTPEELYQALQARIASDDARLTKQLRTAAATHVSADGDVVDGMVHTLRSLPESRRCFALKNSRLRTMLKQVPPKRAMKQLGYRSLDSFLKHETPVAIMAAAWLVEGEAWQHRLQAQYRQLQPGDFEDRQITLTQPTAPRWRELAQGAVARQHHNLLSFKELGALVILPFPSEVPAGAVTASLTLALHELNQIRAASTFLKLCQVRPDFGQVVRTVAREEPQLRSRLLDQPVSWQLIQRYYVRLAGQFREEIFGPHVRQEDMSWQPVEETLAAIEPSFGFWQNSAHLGLTHHDQHVSLNLVDAALNYCNKLPFERRLSHYFQQSLWHELLLRYLKHDTVEQTVLAELQPQLAADTVPA